MIDRDLLTLPASMCAEIPIFLYLSRGTSLGFFAAESHAFSASDETMCHMECSKRPDTHDCCTMA